MDSLTQKITELTGMVNLLMQQIKANESRIKELERPLGLTTSDQVEEPLRGPSMEDDLRDIGRLPDSVKELQTFEGEPSQYVSWVHAVEGILRDYAIVRNKPIYRAILKSIRGKVRGRADTALISYNIFDDDWPSIKRCLSLHYADKRDVRTLEHQLGQLSRMWIPFMRASTINSL